jgi:hypothetical protein
MFNFKIGDITKLLEPGYTFPAALVTGLLLFSPSEYVDALGLAAVTESARTWLGIVFLVSLSLWVTRGAIAVVELVTTSLDARHKKKFRRKYLHWLTPKEKEILRPYLRNDTKTREIKVNSGVTAGLINKKVLYIASNVGYSTILEPTVHYGQVNIHDWAWDYLKGNPNLLAQQENNVA